MTSSILDDKSVTFPGEDPSLAKYQEGLATTHQNPSEDDLLKQQIISITARIEKRHAQCIQIGSGCGSPLTIQQSDNIAAEPPLRAPEGSPEIEEISAEEFARKAQTRSEVRQTTRQSEEQLQKDGTAEQKAKNSPLVQQILAPKTVIPGLYLLANCSEPISQPNSARAERRSQPPNVRESTMTMAEAYVQTGAEPDKVLNPNWLKGLHHIPDHIPGWWAPLEFKQEASSRATSPPQLSPNPALDLLAIDREETIELPYVPHGRGNIKKGNFATPIPVIAVDSPRAPHVATRGGISRIPR